PAPSIEGTSRRSSKMLLALALVAATSSSSNCDAAGPWSSPEKDASRTSPTTEIRTRLSSTFSTVFVWWGEDSIENQTKPARCRGHMHGTTESVYAPNTPFEALFRLSDAPSC